MTSKIIAYPNASGVQLVPDSSGALDVYVNGSTKAFGLSASGILTGLTADSVGVFQSGNVTLTTANTWYSSVNTGAIGAAGQTWLILAKGEITLATGAIAGEIAIHDGTNFLSGGSNVGGAAGWTSVCVAMYFATLTGPTTFTLKAAANANGALLVGNTSYYVVPRSTWITAVRLG